MATLHFGEWMKFLFSAEKEEAANYPSLTYFDVCSNELVQLNEANNPAVSNYLACYLSRQ